jgi:hypothetical protein
MHRFALSNPSRRAARTLVLAIIAVATILSHERPATAQSCFVPPLRDPVCPPGNGTIEQYMTCYRGLYDDNVIPAFTAIAQCSHVKTDVGIRAALETTAAKVLKDILAKLAAIQASLNDSKSAPNVCIAGLNDVDDRLRPFIEAERNAPDLDAYRRSTYTFSHLSFFTDLALLARESRAGCDTSLRLNKEALEELQAEKIQHLDYCQILRQSAKYENVSKIEGLGQYTSLEPDIDYGFFFNLSITVNGQCSYFDPNGGGTGSVRNSQCTTGTVEYKQTLAHLDGTLGWIVKHREMFAVTGLAIGVAAFGPYGALVGVAVEIIISLIDYFTAQSAIGDLEDMIAGKEEELKKAIADNLITEDQFNNRITQLCTPWKTVVERRYRDALAPLMPETHIQEVNKYFALSDDLHDWYNELFRWATTPGPGGARFLDDVAAQDLVAQQHEFDLRVFQSRATQEVASRKNTLTNIKGVVTLMSCSNLTPSQKNVAKSKLRAGVRNFNRTCSTTMDSLVVQPDQPLAFANSTTASDIVCTYKGFRNGFSSLQISNGTGFASNLTFKDKDGVVLAQLTDITSGTDFSQIGLPGLVCSSESGQAFGTSAETQLAARTYPVQLQDNIFGFGETDATSLRTAIQSLDSQLRFKVNTCTQQLGSPVNVPRPVEVCGIPVTF